jgi:uncharacterized protein (TIGR03435 family)
MKFPATLCFTSAALFAQIAPLPPPTTAFEVAAVKLSSKDCLASSPGVILKVENGRFSARCQTLKALILSAFDVRTDQVIGPGWLAEVHLDIEAKLPEGVAESQAPAMLQALLADRLKMTVHRGTSERAIYALTVGKSGLKMVPQEQTAEPELPPSPGSTTFGLPGNELRSNQTAKGTTLSGSGMKMSKDQNGAHIETSRIAALIPVLTEFLGRPVEDKTNLSGAYAIRLDFSNDQLGPRHPGIRFRSRRVSDIFSGFIRKARPEAPV